MVRVTKPDEVPILFSGAMVRAILAGRKTVTRRICALGDESMCPFAPGRIAWVRETWATAACLNHLKPRKLPYGSWVWFAADEPAEDPERGKWRPSIFMMRDTSRIQLRITSRRVERLQDITGYDARAEGLEVSPCDCEACSRTSVMCPATDSAYIAAFFELWDRINGKARKARAGKPPRPPAPWTSNPLVRVISFERVQ